MFRFLIILSIALVAGCAAMDRRALSEFEPLGEGKFRYAAKADSLIYDVNGQDAEAVRMQWLETYLSDNSLCPDGYEITERKPVITQETLTNTNYKIYYRGECK